MPKNLKPVRSKVKAKYDTEVEYLGKQESGESGSNGNEPLHESETTGVKEAREGMLGDLPEEIQEYVEKQVARNSPKKKPAQPSQESGEGQGENGEGEPVQLDENGEQAEPKEESIEDTISNIFDKPLPPALQQKKEALEHAIEEHNAQQEKEPEGFGDEPDEQPAQPEEAHEDAQEQEKPQGEATCTADERAFLDAFMALQEAGSLLGMSPSTRPIAGTKLRNVRLVPVINEIRESDKLYMTEQQTDGAVFEMMGEKTKILFQSAEKMLKSKKL